jgi:hypothetical protein
MLKDPFKAQAIGLIVSLTAQYLLGMYANLFVEFPENASEGQLWEFSWSQIPLALHIIVGLLLTIGATALIARAIKTKNKIWIKSSVVGAVGIIVAAYAGARFIPTQQDFYSYLMSVGFIIAYAAYFWGLYKSR